MGRVYGVLPRQELADSFRSKILVAQRPVEDMLASNQIQPSSVDLRLGDHATCVSSSFLPEIGRESLEAVIERHKMYSFPLSDTHTNILVLDETYIIPVEESADLPDGYHGEINPKSTTGRGDGLTRGLTENVRKFDTVMSGGKRKMYIEVTPLSFNLLVKRGTPLNQLRIKYGDARVDEALLKMKYKETPLLYDPEHKPIPLEEVTFRHGGIEMHADLSEGAPVYRAKRSKQLRLDLSAGRGAQYDQRFELFEEVKPKNGELILEPGHFYLLGTKEKGFFPATMCGTLMAYDVTSAEGRVHYAGFFDPGFFAHGTLEIRVNHTPFRIVDGQPICIMLYEHMRTEPIDESGKIIVYGQTGSTYQHQPRGANLGKQLQKPKAPHEK